MKSIIAILIVIGSESGLQDVYSFNRSLNNHALVDVSHLLHGSVIFIQLRCSNIKELVSYYISPALTVSKGPPDMNHAHVFIAASSPNVYSSNNDHQANSDKVTIGWSGITDKSGIDHYEVIM